MVAEGPGARPSGVARRWQLCPQQVFAWRRKVRAGLLPVQVGLAVPPGPDIVPIHAEPALLPAIKVEVAGAVVRLRPGMDAALLTSALRAVRASAGGA